MYLANWLASITSSGFTRNAHSLTLLPICSRIFGLLQASMTIGTPSSFTTGSAPRHAPLCVWPTITSTLSTSTSLRTALTASPGVPALSPKYSSIFRPAMPPRALYSSASIWAAHFTPSPVIAEGPVMADENPTLTGAARGAASARASAAAAATVRQMESGWVRRIGVSWCSASAEDVQFLARARERAHARGRDLDGVLHLHATPAVLVVRCLHAEDHAR